MTGCEVCRKRCHGKWHEVARGDINPIALIQFVERLPPSASRDAVVGYVYAVTGMDIQKMRDMLAKEEAP